VGWLRRLVGQKLADLGRYHSRAKRAGEATALPLDAAPDAGRGRPGEESGRLLDMLALSQTSPSQAASKREQLVLLADAFAGLPDSEADVLWLYYAENLSFEAIGQRLDLSRKSVRGIYARGLKHLKRSLEGPPGGLLRYDDGSTS
jgi:RNA polymerase sigma-70 factor (ECF subfamily)